MAKLPPSKLLTLWVIDQQQHLADFRVGKFCRNLGVTPRAFWLWRQGTFIPIPEHRATLERLTDGAVPASIWER
jgi:hypothetical protein